MAKNFIITITRQAGSSSLLIAEAMSKKLGIKLYDEEIVEATAEALELSVEEIKAKEENLNYVETNSFTRMEYSLVRNANALQNKIYETQEKFIKEIAARNESCIIVGRCADYILLDEDNVLFFHIHAPYEDRIAKTMEMLELEENEAKKYIIERDKARDAYHLHFAGFLANNVDFKDVAIDSSLLGVEGTANLLVDIVKKRFDLE